MDFLRLYPDKNGESHFDQGQVDMDLREFAPPAPPVFVSSEDAASGILFMRAPAGWTGDWHPSPARMYLLVVSGSAEFESSVGEVRKAPAGTVILLEDTVGKGHRSRVPGPEDVTIAFVKLG